MTLAPDLDNAKCSPTVLCRHSYVTESDDVAVDRESRDLQRIACLNSADIIVTHSPDSVRFMHRDGGWIEHDGESIAQVEVMLFRAYAAIEAQIYAGDSGLLVGQDLIMMLPSRLGCPLSLKTPNKGNPGLVRLRFPVRRRAGTE